jgi:phosphoribosylanthranilate isomerase
MTRVKICGLTALDDALAAAEAGADLLGFILVRTSPRYVHPSRAAEIVAGLRREGVTLPCVGVVAGLPLAGVQGLICRCGFDLVQLHGGEGPEVARALYPRAIVARQVSGPASLEGLSGYPAYAYLLDSRGATQRAEGAAVWDWRLLRGAGIGGRVIIAGGLTPENVAAAVCVARPWGVDVASGVEAQPGRKDRAAVDRFIRAVREVTEVT